MDRIQSGAVRRGRASRRRASRPRNRYRTRARIRSRSRSSNRGRGQYRGSFSGFRGNRFASTPSRYSMSGLNRNQSTSDSGYSGGSDESPPPNIPAGSSSDDNLCPICHQTITNSAITNCNHRFCLACIRRWTSRNPSCPTCRSIVRTIVSVRPNGQTETIQISRAELEALRVNQLHGILMLLFTVISHSMLPEVAGHLERLNEIARDLNIPTTSTRRQNAAAAADDARRTMSASSNNGSASPSVGPGRTRSPIRTRSYRSRLDWSPDLSLATSTTSSEIAREANPGSSSADTSTTSSSTSDTANRVTRFALGSILNTIGSSSPESIALNSSPMRPLATQDSIVGSRATPNTSISPAAPESPLPRSTLDQQVTSSSREYDASLNPSPSMTPLQSSREEPGRYAQRQRDINFLTDSFNRINQVYEVLMIMHMVVHRNQVEIEPGNQNQANNSNNTNNTNNSRS